MHEVMMPASGMAMTEGLLVRWLKRPGEIVTRGEPLAEIETDKSTMEMESPAAGRLGPLLFEAGAMVPIGVPIVHILEDTDTDAGAGVSEAPRSGDVSRVAPVGVQAASLAVASDRASTDGSPPARPDPIAATIETAVRGNGAGHDASSIDALRLALIPQAPRRTAPPNGAAFGAGRAASAQDNRTAMTGGADMETDDVRGLDTAGLAADDLVAWLETMVLIREFEQACEPLAASGKIPGGIHSAAGQEAIAVGAIRALAPTDIVTSTHRSHHHSLAKGLTPRAIMAELYGKATGCLGGRGGHMHLADFSIGLFGSNGVVGAGLGLAMGASLGARMRGLDQVALGFFGDGGANTGRVWETVNLAALWKLPLVVICENNLYAVETYLHRAMAGPSIAARAAGFGLPSVTIDGQDVAAMYRATAEARARAVSGDGPTFIEAQTYRYEGHNTGDVGNYREQSEVERWRRTRDPLLRVRRSLEEAEILIAGQYDAVVTSARETVADAVRFAEESPWPDPETALANVVGLELSEENR